MTPLSDQKTHQQQLGLVYDQRAQQLAQTLHRPPPNNYRVVVTSDSSARSTKTYFMNNVGRGNVRSPRDYQQILSPTSFQRATEGGSASARGFSQQRMNKKRTENPSAIKVVQNEMPDDQGSPSLKQKMTLDTETSEIPFIVTKHGG